jgi:hypothetical protein
MTRFKRTFYQFLNSAPSIEIDGKKKYIVTNSMRSGDYYLFWDWFNFGIRLEDEPSSVDVEGLAKRKLQFFQISGKKEFDVEKEHTYIFELSGLWFREFGAKDQARFRDSVIKFVKEMDEIDKEMREVNAILGKTNA